jgi:hypothetical protein
MNERQTWTGIAPSPTVLAQLDYEEMAILALLSWSTAANRPVTSADVADLEDRDGKKLGLTEARDIVKTLGDMKIVSVYGMNNERPMSVRLGGFQPRTPRRFMDDRRPAAPRASTPPPRRAPSHNPGRGAKKGTPPWVLKDRRVEAGLEVTPRTPDYVLPESARLREEQVRIEGGNFTGNLVEAADARLAVLKGRIKLYERWLKDEPRHPNLSAVLAKKRKAVPEMEFQVERAAVKQQELETEGA